MKTQRKWIEIQTLINVMVLLFLITKITFAQLANSPWPIYRQNIQRTAKSNFAGPETGTFAWMLEFDEDKISPVVVDTVGNLYVNSEKHLYCITPGGQLKWKYLFSQEMKTSSLAEESIPAPAISENGVIYVHHGDSLFAINSDGNFKWSFYLGGSLEHYPIISSDNIIYLVERALFPNGNLMWEVDLRISSGIACMDSQGTLYWAGKGNLYAMNSNGTEKWKYPADNANYRLGEPSVAPDGTIYCKGGTYKGHELWAFSSDGSRKWTYEITGIPWRSPAIDTDGTIYFGGRGDSTIYSLNPAGILNWRYKLNSWSRSTNVIDKNSAIYCPAYDGLYVLNNDGTLKWRYSGSGKYSSAGPVTIGGEGLLYFSLENKLYALTDFAGESDLAITEIKFNPLNGVTRGAQVKVIANVSDLTGNTNTRCSVTFYVNNTSNPIGFSNVFVPAGGEGIGEITWNTSANTVDSYQVIAKISDAIPVETNTSNNEFSTLYHILPFIQPRINAASINDTVWVEPGTYFENINLEQNVVLKSIEGSDLTILDGSGNGSVITITAGIIDGFTITNGNASSGGGINVQPGSPIIRNNKIIRNKANLGAGIDVYGLTVSPLIEHNLIAWNSATSKGDAIYGPNSNAKIINNTIVFNNGEAGDGINASALNFAVPTINNCIIWGNGDDLTGDAVATYSCIQDGDVGTGNFSNNPLFIDPENEDYSLMENSPCIDAGDPTSPLDPDGTRADIGAYYFDQSPTSVNASELALISEFSLSQNYPNPFNPTTKINYSVKKAGNVRIDIYNISGKLVRTLIDEIKPVGNYAIEWDGMSNDNNRVSSGHYFYQLKIGGYVEMKKMVLIK